MVPAIIAQLGSNVDVRWRQICSNALLQVESQLGITLQATVNRANNCLFVGVKSDTWDNLHINGIDWHEDLREDVINVVVGIKNYWFNEKFLWKLFRNRKYIDVIIDYYSKCGFEFHFERWVRLNSKQQKLFVYIKEYPGTRQGLEDYLRDVTASEVYCPSMSPEDCIAELQKLGVPSVRKSPKDEETVIEKLKRYNFKSYGWLEYLQIAVRPPISVPLLLEGDHATFDQLYNQLKTQIVALILLALIYREDPDTVRKIEKLLEKLFE